MKKVSGIHHEACRASGRSRACATCEFNGRGMRAVCDICHRAFVEGFEKGARFVKKNNGDSQPK